MVDEKIDNLILVSGAETYLVEKCVDKVINQIKSLHQNDSRNLEVIKNNAKETTVLDLQESFSVSMFSDIEILIFWEANKFSDKTMQVLEQYLTDPDTDKYVILTAENFSKSKKLAAAVKGVKSSSYDFPKITKEAERLSYIRQCIKDLGGNVDRLSAQLILDYVGNDLRALDIACKQIFSDGEGIVTKELIDKYYSRNAKVNSFTMLDELFSGNLGTAREQLFWILNSGTAPLIVADSLGQALHEIALVYRAQAYEVNELAKFSGIPSWRLKKAQTRGRKITNFQVLTEFLELAKELNFAVKGGSEFPEYALEKAIVSIGNKLKPAS